MENVLTKGNGLDGQRAKLALTRSIQAWFLAAVLGQLIFAVYVVMFYWATALSGNTQLWTEVLPKGIIEGDTIGNITLATHLILAAIITLGGLLQLVPWVRSKVPALHRWNGRIYLVTAVVMSVSGLIIVWTRGTVGDMVQHWGVSLNGVLILLFAFQAVRYAVKRNLVLHRRWALRLFVVVSGVWFFRIGLMFWLAVNQGPVGIYFESFTGPFLYFLAFANYLLPLAVLEMYLRAQSSKRASFQWFTAGVLVLATLATLVGIGMASMGMWLPQI